ncbi:XkdX family protein [uncultured Clostridium sp.]|uniref:XkdX family protein n=1 Tax=uncultured Clostridium sp. TaxID=59620 RepID=UPI00261CCC5E|nr:XkdX family protein [uncultured Clostridium sp.]
MESIVLEMYQAGNWSLAQVRELVPTVITATQFQQITGQSYIEKTPMHSSTQPVNNMFVD